MKKGSILLIFMMALLSFWQWSYYKFREYFSDTRDYIEANHELKVSLLKSQAQQDLLTYKYQVFQQNVAALLPNIKSDLKKDYQVRSLASVVTKENPDIIKYSKIDARIDLVMKEFSDRKYGQVITSVNEILALDPISPNLVNLYFILAESYYQTHELNLCVETSQKMMELFPESDKTGMILLRVGMLLKEKNRFLEAKETWLVASKAFSSNIEIQNQTKKLLRSLE